MKTKNWIAAEKDVSNEKGLNPDKGIESANFYGRAHNEATNFSQANFDAFQDILNQRNSMLGTVKSMNHL